MQKRFHTNFSTQGWLPFYLAAMFMNIVIGFIRTPFTFLIGDPMVIALISLGSLFVQSLIMSFLITAAYTKAILLLVNTLSCGDKNFSTKLDYNSFFALALANIILCIFTLGIYIPWAYKAIIDRLVNSIEYEGEGSFSFLSKASKLFLFFLVSIIIIFFLALLFTIAIVAIANISNYILLLIFIPIIVLIFFAILAFALALQVFTINWIINISYNHSNKNVTYTLNIDIASAIMFYLGQSILLLITFGFYVGVYLISIYEYFVSRIVEKENDVITGHFMFKKPLNQGAGFIFIQVLVTVLTFGIYAPWAYVEYAKFFINNTYLETKDELGN